MTLGAFGELFGSLLGTLGALWAPFGSLGGAWGVPWEPFGRPFWEDLASLGALGLKIVPGLLKGVREAPKILPKTIKNNKKRYF